MEPRTPGWGLVGGRGPEGSEPTAQVVAWELGAGRSEISVINLQAAIFRPHLKLDMIIISACKLPLSSKILQIMSSVSLFVSESQASREDWPSTALMATMLV